MVMISKKKKYYPISGNLRKYLQRHGRELEIPISYHDLTRYDNAIPLYDIHGKDTLWETVFYPQDDMAHIYESLKKIYAIIKADGDMSVMVHLRVERVDACTYGNTFPFRVRIVNQINDNFDYFYIKRADASRVYGLELEHLLSPNRISYVVHKDTLIEEHIPGIPGDQFIKKNLADPTLNKIRLAKEFVKFTERCFIRLLGDMHSSNFVIDITPDFEEVHYRIRAIDFDQQSFEGRKTVYMPQYFKQNNPIIEVGLKVLTPESVKQYQKEERSLIAARLKTAHRQIMTLLHAMMKDRISEIENVEKLKQELANHYNEKAFLDCTCMGELVKCSLETVLHEEKIKNSSDEPQVSE